MRAQQMPQPGSQPSSRLVMMCMAAVVVMPIGYWVRVAHVLQHAGQNLLQHLDHSSAQAPANAFAGNGLAATYRTMTPATDTNGIGRHDPLPDPCKLFSQVDDHLGQLYGIF